MKFYFRLGCLFLVGASLVAGAQDRGKVPLLEYRDDPPAPPRGYLPPPPITFLPRADFGTYHSVQVNVDVMGNNIVGDAANEPSLCMGPSGRHSMAIGWRQFNDVASNFRQGGYGYTTNGGASWSFPGVLENNVFRSDPVLGTSAEGKFFYLSLQETFFDQIWASLTGGSNWIEEAEATGGDKQWMTIDRTAGIGHGNFYQYWSTAGNNWGGRQFSRSTDGGFTWMDPINIPNSVVWGVLDVANNGNLYLIGTSSGSFRVIRSSNAQNPAVTPTFDQNVVVNLTGTIQSGQVVNPGGLSGQAWLAIDKSVGTGTSNNVYALCSVRRNATNPCDVMFSRSTDGGLTWSTAKRINDDAAGQTRYHWFGTMAVAPNGRIDVVWNDTRADSTNTLSALYYSASFDGGLTFTPNVQVSPAFNPHLGYPNQNKMGDYLGVVSDNGGANVAFAATFNGEQDVYYLRIPGPIRYNVNADSFAMVEGASSSGSVPDVWNEDANRFNIVSQFIAGTGQVASAVADYTVPADAVNDLWVTIKATAPAGTAESVFVFNWGTQQYDRIATLTMTKGPDKYTYSLQGDPAPYVSGAQKVRVLIRTLMPPAGTNLNRSSLSVDLARLSMN